MTDKPKSLAVDPALAASIQFSAPSGTQWLFRIKPDGNVELNEGVSLDEASRAFWSAVEQMLPAKAPRSLDDVAMDALRKAGIEIWDDQPQDDMTVMMTFGGLKRVINAALLGE